MHMPRDCVKRIIMNQPENSLNHKSFLNSRYEYLRHLCLKYHICFKLKILINCFIIVLPAFVQYLLFDEPGYLISFVLCFCFLISAFFLTRARLILTLPLAILSFVYTFFLVVYHKSLGTTSIMALMNTEVDVMFNFTVSPIMVTATIIFVLAFAMYFRFIILKGADDDNEVLIPKGKGYIPATVMVSTFVFIMLGYGYMTEAYPFSMFNDSTTYVKIVSEMKKTADKRYDFEGTLRPGYKEGKGSFILIIGETDRRASWSLYGYERETNAFLKADIDKHPENFILFNNYIATAQTTYPSLMSIFSVIPAKDFVQIPRHPSFVRILKNLGYGTYFVSTYENIFMNFINADQNIIIKDEVDTALIPVLKTILNSEKGAKKLIVVHLRGSHCAFSQYKYAYGDYIFPNKNSISDKYDKSIMCTDMFLKGISELVMSEKNPLCAWYMPDHGENLNDSGDRNFMHGCGGFTKYEIELPSVMIFNDRFMESTPEIKTLNGNRDILLSHSNVSHTVMGICGVYPREYQSKYDASSGGFRYEEPYLVDVDLFPVRYSNARIK